jgi:NAD(P)-dependent dehydrogenase (short-subunit alcohol dehydrogenase family)
LRRHSRVVRLIDHPPRVLVARGELEGGELARGFGHGIATALSKAGANVVGVARDRGPLEELRAQLGESFTAVPADAADPVVAGQLIDAYRPAILVLNAGATPLPRPVQHAPAPGPPRPARHPLTMDVTSAAQIQAAAGQVARAIFDGVENGEEDIFPDPTSASLADGWRDGVAKAFERQNAAFVQPQPAAT